MDYTQWLIAGLGIAVILNGICIIWLTKRMFDLETKLYLALPPSALSSPGTHPDL